MSQCAWIDPAAIMAIEYQSEMAKTLTEDPRPVNLRRLDTDRCIDTGIWRIVQHDGAIQFSCNAHLSALLREGAQFFAADTEEVRAVIFKMEEEHQPFYVGLRKFGYKQCMVCNTPWPCLAVRASTFITSLEPVYPQQAALEGEKHEGTLEG